MDSFEIKLATSENFSSLRKLSLLLDPTAIDKEEKIKKTIANGHAWVVMDGEQVVGYCLVELFDDKHDQLPNSIFLSELYVLEEYRKKGGW